MSDAMDPVRNSPPKPSPGTASAAGEISNGMEPRYDIEKTEAEIYKLWEESGFFNPDVCVKEGATKADAEPYSIVLPPPNVTGELHLGHAAMLAIEDIMIRFERMRGKRTLWLPGTDHAAIATQSKVEGALYKEEKKTRYDLGREEFVRRVEAYAQQSHDTIVNQVKRMGSSLDWSREAYTLDEARTYAVRTAFKRMYDLGLIYRGARIVNWDPKLKTTVSDDEVEWKEKKDALYYLKYGPFVIATARPETKFGDKYVVMHPDDKRYKDYKDGQKLEFEWINGPITATVVKDAIIDMGFGTGVMTITPWHDATDFDIAERHGLDKEQVIDYDGRLLPIAGEFAGLYINKARAAIVEKLKTKGLLEKTEENYAHNIAVNSRGGGMIEPQIKEQWFINVNAKFKNQSEKLKDIKKGQEVSLKELMQTAVRSGQITIVPERFGKTYFHWIDNLRDWCISRQIWFGHQIPVWYRNGEMYCDVNPAQGDGWEQDPDTLDTWFSSGLWTFSTLGWPNDTADFRTFHPTAVLETGYDILFFWVARMILVTTCLVGDVPFRAVYLHGIVRDEKGRKMSKSLNNGIDPLDMANKYGADATRLALIIGTGAGNDQNLSENKVRGYRNFATKIWNASRFVLMNKPTGSVVPMKIGTQDLDSGSQPGMTDARNGYLEELTRIKAEVTAHLESYEFHLAGEKAYHYFWHTFADIIIESEKQHFKGGDEAEKNAAYALLEHILIESLKMLHPFMPFVTEAVYQKFRPGKLLMVEPW